MSGFTSASTKVRKFSHRWWTCADSFTYPRKKDEIYKRYGKDWNIREQGGGNGNWLLTRKSDVLVDGKSYRTFVLEHYGKSKLTAKLVDKFREDVANGKIKL